MKKIFALLFCCGFLFSCAPKRMSCYGKRCVENTTKQDITKPKQVNS